MWGYGPEWGMMGGWGGYGWFGIFHMIFWLVILALIVMAVVWLFRGGAHVKALQSRSDSRLRGLDVLEERYARGEIKREEYLEKKKDILG